MRHLSPLEIQSVAGGIETFTLIGVIIGAGYGLQRSATIAVLNCVMASFEPGNPLPTIAYSFASVALQTTFGALCGAGIGAAADYMLR